MSHSAPDGRPAATAIRRTFQQLNHLSSPLRGTDRWGMDARHEDRFGAIGPMRRERCIAPLPDRPTARNLPADMASPPRIAGMPD